MGTTSIKGQQTGWSGNYPMTEAIVVSNFSDVVWANIPQNTASKYPIVMREVDCNRGRADVVCAVIRKNNIDSLKLRHLGLSLSQPAKAHILSWLSKNKASTEEYLSEVTGLRVKTIRKHLNELLESGIVKHSVPNSWVFSKEYKLPQIDIWSFEVKLKNWKRACYQASRYRGFSHYTTVVMPQENVHTAIKNIDMFDKMNIGLMAIDKQSKLKFIKKPKRSNPTSKKHHLYALGKIIMKFCQSYPRYQHKRNFRFIPILRRIFG